MFGYYVAWVFVGSTACMVVAVLILGWQEWRSHRGEE
jgi:hypothetical protein